MLCIARLDLANEFVCPFAIDGEDIVGDPHDVRVVLFLQHEDLVDNVLRGALAVRVPENFTRAPGAMKWAAAGSD